MSAEVLTALQTSPEADPSKAAGVINAIAEETPMPEIPDVLSILPVRGFVVFPATLPPLNVRRRPSIKMLDETLPQSKIIGLLTHRDPDKEEPPPQDLYDLCPSALVL